MKELQKEINRALSFKKGVLYADYEHSTFSKSDIKCTFQELRRDIKWCFRRYKDNLKDKKKMQRLLKKWKENDKTVPR
jgi:hypothetical protein